MPAIPDRWIQYKACGKVIEGTRFICFKVPLRKNVQSGNPDIKEIWDIPALLSNIPNLGAVIDLTNTMRYYNPAELKAAGILHKKILIPGRIIPPESTVTEFMNSVDEFLEKDREFLIGVHCTHGLNRTGYMVCRYMRDRLGISAKDAIKKFERARGYQIERANYIADLLGSPPPEPDFGPHTSIKPVSDEITNSRSPLAQEKNYEEHQRDRYNRPDRRKSRSNYSRYDDDDDYKRSNWRDRSKSPSNCRSRHDLFYRSRRKVSRSDSGSSRNSSFDYRYDY